LRDDGFDHKQTAALRERVAFRSSTCRDH
jgi:hypothetical protein